MSHFFKIIYLVLFAQTLIWIGNSRLPFPQLYSNDFSLLGAFEYIQFNQIFSSFIVSFQIGILAIIFCAIFCIPASIFIAKLSGWAQIVLSNMLYIPVLAPLLLPSIGLYEFMYEINLIGSIFGVALAQSCVLYPYMLKPIEDTLRSNGFKQELAAKYFGASKWQIFSNVTFNRIKRPLVQGSFFVFVGSFNDYIISFLLGDFNVKTLSVILYPLMQSDNRVTSTMIIIIYTLPLIVLYIALSKLFKRKSNA